MRSFDCLSNVSEVTVTLPAGRSHADLFIYLFRPQCSSPTHAGRPTAITQVFESQL